jgi:hypothetical protein
MRSADRYLPLVRGGATASRKAAASGSNAVVRVTPCALDIEILSQQWGEIITVLRYTLRANTPQAYLEAAWKQSLYTRRGYVIYRARLRTDLLDNRSLDMLLEISKRLIY